MLLHGASCQQNTDLIIFNFFRLMIWVRSFCKKSSNCRRQSNRVLPRVSCIKWMALQDTADAQHLLTKRIQSMSADSFYDYFKEKVRAYPLYMEIFELNVDAGTVTKV